MMLGAGCTGTDVNNAVTSYEQRHSPGWRVTLLTLSTKSLILGHGAVTFLLKV